MKVTGSRKALSTDVHARTPAVRRHRQNGRGPRTVTQASSMPTRITFV